MKTSFHKVTFAMAPAGASLSKDIAFMIREKLKAPGEGGAVGCQEWVISVSAVTTDVEFLDGILLPAISTGALIASWLVV